MKKITNKSSSLTKYEWIWFAQGYLSIARTAVDRLLENDYEKERNKIANPDKYLPLAIIFNFKHALEIILKSLDVNIDKEYLITHNLQHLTEDLLPKLKKLDTKGSQRIVELSQIVYKYFKLEFWNKKTIENSIVLDESNDIFKYPENTAKFILSPQITWKITNKDLQEIKTDIEDVNKLLFLCNKSIDDSKLKSTKQSHSVHS